jgi:hypothetical protein
MAFMCGLIVWLRIVYPMHATFVAIFFLVCWMNKGYVDRVHPMLECCFSMKGVEAIRIMVSR